MRATIAMSGATEPAVTGAASRRQLAEARTSSTVLLKESLERKERLFVNGSGVLLVGATAVVQLYHVVKDSMNARVDRIRLDLDRQCVYSAVQ